MVRFMVVSRKGSGLLATPINTAGARWGEVYGCFLKTSHNRLWVGGGGTQQDPGHHDSQSAETSSGLNKLS